MRRTERADSTRERTATSMQMCAVALWTLIVSLVLP